MAREIGDKSYESENLQMIGLMHIGRHGVAEFSLGMEYANQSLSISQEAHLLWHLAPALGTKGSISLGLGDIQGGIDQLARAIEQARAIGALRYVSIDLCELGNCYQALNLFKRAEMVHSEGLEIERQIGTHFFLPRLKADLGIDRLRMGDLGVGPDLEEALEGAQSRGQLAHAVRCLEGLVELSLTLGDHESAYRRAAELLHIAQAGELRELISRAYLWQGKIRLAEGNAKAAEGSLRKAANLAEVIGEPRLRWDVHEAMAEVYKAQGEQMLADEHYQVVREIIQRISANLKDAELRKGLPEI